MLIIFDLDDTLIDTSKYLTPSRLQRALEAMVQAGLTVPNASEALDLLKRLDAHAPSAREALIEFLDLLGADKRFLEIALVQVYETNFLDDPIFAVEEAPQILLELSSLHKLALVTIGKPEIQFEKMKKAGIDSTIFSKIVVTEERSKKLHYQVIAEEFGALDTEILVCGDRIPIDLTPAKELGFKTVHMQRGRGLNAGGSQYDVDFKIRELGDIRSIINSLLI